MLHHRREARKRDTLSCDFPQNLYCHRVTSPSVPSRNSSYRSLYRTKVQLPGLVLKEISVTGGGGGVPTLVSGTVELIHTNE